MTDPIADILGDYRAFFAGQKDRLRARGIDISPYSLSHLAYRIPEYDRYLHVRGLLERHAAANVENVWNGRPISKILLREPLHVEPHVTVELIELIPPVHQRVYKMGLEHVGVVVGDAVDEFARTNRAALTGQQFQSEDNEPYYILFEDFTHVKFYRYSLRAVVERQGGRSTASSTSTIGSRRSSAPRRRAMTCAAHRDRRTRTPIADRPVARPVGPNRDRDHSSVRPPGGAPALAVVVGRQRD